MVKYFRFLLVASFLFFSCTSDDSGNVTETDSFDRGAMLANWADNIIIPSYENFAGFTNALEEKTTQFVENPTKANLEELRTAYREAYVNFQTVAPYWIGEAETLNYHRFLNTYPAAVSAIENKAISGDYNLKLPSSYAEQGLPALDYLLYGLAPAEQDLLAQYTSGSNAAGYKQYLKDVVARVDFLTNRVLNDWENGYRDSFVSNTSSSSTGSVDRFTNDYIMYLEMYLRSGKIGIPAGAFTGNPVPQNVEALYSEGLSKDLYLKALQNVQDFFNGKHFEGGQTGPSYKQYLDYLNSVKNEEDLSALTNAQFNVVKQQAESLNPDFSEQIAENNTLMLQTFDELQKIVVLLKVDMMQALSISVDYVDSDGD